MFPSPFSPVTAEVISYQLPGTDPDSQEQQYPSPEKVLLEGV